LLPLPTQPAVVIIFQREDDGSITHIEVPVVAWGSIIDVSMGPSGLHEPMYLAARPICPEEIWDNNVWCVRVGEGPFILPAVALVHTPKDAERIARERLKDRRPRGESIVTAVDRPNARGGGPN
jgi:hypothetical protein